MESVTAIAPGTEGRGPPGCGLEAQGGASGTDRGKAGEGGGLTAKRAKLAGTSPGRSAASFLPGSPRSWPR